MKLLAITKYSGIPDPGDIYLGPKWREYRYGCEPLRPIGLLHIVTELEQEVEHG